MAKPDIGYSFYVHSSLLRRRDKNVIARRPKADAAISTTVILSGTKDLASERIKPPSLSFPRSLPLMWSGGGNPFWSF